jgi:hypothetical protein
MDFRTPDGSRLLAVFSMATRWFKRWFIWPVVGASLDDALQELRIAEDLCRTQSVTLNQQIKRTEQNLLKYAKFKNEREFKRTYETMVQLENSRARLENTTTIIQRLSLQIADMQSAENITEAMRILETVMNKSLSGSTAAVDIRSAMASFERASSRATSILERVDDATESATSATTQEDISQTCKQAYLEYCSAAEYSMSSAPSASEDLPGSILGTRQRGAFDNLKF